MFHGIGGCFTELFQKNFPVGSDGITSVLCPVVVSLGMTLTAQQLEVVPIKSDLRIVNCYRIYFDSMMHNLPRLINPTTQTILAQEPDAPCVTVPAILPALRTVECFCEILSHDFSFDIAIQKDGSLRPSLGVTYR